MKGHNNHVNIKMESAESEYSQSFWSLYDQQTASSITYYQLVHKFLINMMIPIPTWWLCSLIYCKKCTVIKNKFVDCKMTFSVIVKKKISWFFARGPLF